MVRSSLVLYFLMVLPILAIPHEHDFVRKLHKPVHTEGGEDIDGSESSSSGGGSGSSGGSSGSSSSTTSSTATASSSSGSSSSGGGSSGGGSSTLAAFPSSPTSNVVASAPAGLSKLMMVGAIGGLALMAGVCVMLALAKRRRRRSPKIVMDEEVLVNRQTAKASTPYKLEPLQDQLPIPVPHEIATPIALETESSVVKPRTQKNPRVFKSILMTPLGRRNFKTTAVPFDSASCSSIGSSIP